MCKFSQKQVTRQDKTLFRKGTVAASWLHFYGHYHYQYHFLSRVIMGAARPFSNADTTLWRLTMWDYTLSLSQSATHNHSTLFVDHYKGHYKDLILILLTAVKKHTVHGTCTGTTINIVSKGSNYSNHNSIPSPVVELSCRLVLNLRQFPNPQFRLLFWACCQAEWTITDWFPNKRWVGSDLLSWIVLNISCKLDMWIILEVASKNWILSFIMHHQWVLFLFFFV